MRLYEDADVRAIYRACHPTWPARPPRWFEAHPTLVLEHQRAIIGYTSYSLVIQPNVSMDGEVMVGYGIDLLPGYHGKGFGRALCDERLAVARAVGATVFVGHAAPDNVAMIRLFEADGFTRHGVPSAYPDGTPMHIYIGKIR
jgi:GNAT superfamily N-acetyltransferase